MLNIEFARSVINDFKKELKTFQVYLTDQTFPLDERWSLYLLIQPFLKTYGCFISLISIENHHEISWYDDFYLERGSVQHLDDGFIKFVNDKNWNINISELKEEILAFGSKGYGSFENDW